MKLQAECDVECYRNYFLVKFYIEGGGFRKFEMNDNSPPINLAALRATMYEFELVTFNGIGYDVPMIAAALMGFDCAKLKECSDGIIQGNLRHWQFYRQFNVQELNDLQHIDIMEVAPGVRIGLKVYMGRMHSKTMQDLPVEHDAMLTPEQMRIIDKYNDNDLTETRKLKETIANPLKLRRQISADIGVDVMSKSDAQIAEEVICSRLGYRPKKQPVQSGRRFFYVPPEFISFQTEQMREVLRVMTTSAFIENDPDLPGAEVFTNDAGEVIKAAVITPPEFKALLPTIGGTTYKFGIGGLHSQEKAMTKLSSATNVIKIHDVASYYPNLILLMGMYPRAIGPQFIEIYGSILKQRMEAKRSGNKQDSNTLKITLNGAFGKLGSKYSILCAPDLMIRTTVTGQLALMMLIESMELAGIPVISANTDGVVTNTPAGLESARERILTEWQQRTGLELECEPFAALYARDVNSYIAFHPDRSHIAKGAFSPSGVAPASSPSGITPAFDIINDAIIALLRDNTPLMETIRNCTDIRRFVKVARCAGGGVFEETGELLGVNVRFYYARGSVSGIRSASLRAGQTVGNLVGGSTGCRPCMTLPDELPGDIDYDRYAIMAYEQLNTLGVLNAS